MSALNGGPAFPVSTRGTGESDDTGSYGHQDSELTWQYPGMTLRDYFAAKAMQGWVSRFTTDDGEPRPVPVARLAYEIADAMLAARTGGDA